ncbi:MAG: hypothetical protein KKD29_03880 [Candidatus Omnitrophica bacterium]|nr:hypothetical protein [Candidatus Omnitrophota bacterium]MBU4487585.1 hypothetical protein [Candidatus Omnitrophota bacterium]MCG2705191.1 hypothetical protein [Candidatus Omnitrophota bacterium]
MHFYLIGIDYKTTPIDARDVIYRNRKLILKFWESAYAERAEAIVTCNRIEIYGVSQNAQEAEKALNGFYESAPDFSKHAHVKHGRQDVFRHALRVASGLESQLRGETEILAQIKRWRSGHYGHPSLKSLWDEVILFAENIRLRYGLNYQSDNIATVVFEDLAKRLPSNETAKILVIGTGKIAELIAKHRQTAFHITFVAHKNRDKAEALARESGGDALLLSNLTQAIPAVFAVISATSSPHHILKRGHFSNALNSRSVPLYLYDLAVPRDIEPSVGGIDGIFLQNLDDLGKIFEKYNERRQKSVDAASKAIEEIISRQKENVYASH